MNAKYIRWAYGRQVPNALTKYVLVTLAFTSDRFGQCVLPQRRLASLTGLGVRTIRSHLGWLEDEGFIARRERSRDDGGRACDQYRLAPDDERPELNGYEAFYAVSTSTGPWTDYLKKCIAIWNKERATSWLPLTEWNMTSWELEQLGQFARLMRRRTREDYNAAVEYFRAGVVWMRDHETWWRDWSGPLSFAQLVAKDKLFAAAQSTKDSEERARRVAQASLAHSDEIGQQEGLAHRAPTCLLSTVARRG